MKTFIRSLLSSFIIITLLTCISVFASEISTYGYTRCPRCGIDVTYYTDYDVELFGTEPCINGLSGKRDSVFSRYRVTYYSCAANCGWSTSEKVLIGYQTVCDHT